MGARWRLGADQLSIDGFDVDSDLNGRGSGELVIVDHRFLVPDLVPADLDRQEVFLRFGNKYDVTNQVVTARVEMDGTLIDLSIES